MAAGASSDIVWTSLIPGLNWLEHYFVNPETGAPGYHVSNGILVSLIILLLVVLGTSKLKKGELNDEDLVPDATLTARNFLELLVTAIRGIMKDSLGDAAPKFLYLIGTFGFFILFSNLSGLVPGFMPPTDNINTTLALALIVFVAYNAYGIKEHGALKYGAHFCGPFWWLAWLMLPIEIISHCARPMSLSLRLFGNIMGDHLVGAIFFSLVPVLVPVFTSVLGLFVSCIQTFVFMLLSMAYLSGAIAHEEH